MRLNRERLDALIALYEHAERLLEEVRLSVAPTDEDRANYQAWVIADKAYLEQVRLYDGHLLELADEALCTREITGR